MVFKAGAFQHITGVGWSADPVITEVTPPLLVDGDTITITGTGFDAVQGAGSVEIADAASGSGTRWKQTDILSWSNTEIQFVHNRRNLIGTSGTLYVTDDSGAEGSRFVSTKPFDFWVRMGIDTAIDDDEAFWGQSTFLSGGRGWTDCYGGFWYRTTPYSTIGSTFSSAAMRMKVLGTAPTLPELGIDPHSWSKDGAAAIMRPIPQAPIIDGRYASAAAPGTIYETSRLIDPSTCAIGGNSTYLAALQNSQFNTQFGLTLPFSRADGTPPTAFDADTTEAQATLVIESASLGGGVPYKRYPFSIQPDATKPPTIADLTVAFHAVGP